MSKVRNILFYVLLLVYLGVGIYTIVISNQVNGTYPWRCGLLIMLSSIVHILLYIVKQGYKYKEKGFFLVIGLIGLALGIIFLVNKKADIYTICLYWGLLDIVRGSLEIKDIIPELKNNKLEIVELVISIGDIVLGILLCLRQESGLQVHVIYIGASFILTCIKLIVDEIIQKRVKKPAETE